MGKAYIIRVSEAECEISLVARNFRSSNGFTPRKWLFLAKFSPLQNLKVVIYNGFVIYFPFPLTFLKLYTSS